MEKRAKTPVTDLLPRASGGRRKVDEKGIGLGFRPHLPDLSREECVREGGRIHVGNEEDSFLFGYLIPDLSHHRRIGA
jgi:hypothetical protein